MNTFTGNDYETGGVPASTYNPTHLDVRQWIRVARDLGAKYAVLTAKPCGFCLWDSEGYDYDIAASRNKTDVVAAFMAACKEYGLKPGFLLYPRPAQRRQIRLGLARPRELLQADQAPAHRIAHSLSHAVLPVARHHLESFAGTALGTLPSHQIDEPRLHCGDEPGLLPEPPQSGTHREIPSWPCDVINAEDTLPPPEGHDPNVKVQGVTRYMPMESWIPTGPPYKPMPPMHSWFWRPGFEDSGCAGHCGCLPPVQSPEGKPSAEPFARHYRTIARRGGRDDEAGCEANKEVGFEVQVSSFKRTESLIQTRAETRNSKPKLETSSSPHCCGVKEMFSPVVSSTSFFLEPTGGLDT